MNPVLILGGTADARRVTQLLHEQGLPLLYSVAGLVRRPNVPAEVISGGFTQFGGLSAYIKSRNVVAIINATHPYTEKMSETAQRVAKQENIPYWRFLRPAWQAQEKDHWILCKDWLSLIEKIKPYKNVFFTAGQLPQKVLDALGPMQQITVRTAVKPKAKLPENCHWIKAIGPFDYEREMQLIRQKSIDVLVSKNSGGEATVAKLAVARNLGIPVLMLERPETIIEAGTFDNSAAMIAACVRWYHGKFPPDL